MKECTDECTACTNKRGKSDLSKYLGSLTQPVQKKHGLVTTEKTTHPCLQIFRSHKLMS